VLRGLVILYRVNTNSARYQDISLNPQKLAGQCGKLKCCLNFEVDTYLDAQKDFPAVNVPLETENGSDRDTLTSFDDPKQAGNKKHGNNRRRKFRPKQ